MSVRTSQNKKNITNNLQFHCIQVQYLKLHIITISLHTSAISKVTIGSTIVCEKISNSQFISLHTDAMFNITYKANYM